MRRPGRGALGPSDLDALIDEITIDAENDDEKIRAFRQVLEDGVAVPTDAFVIGEPVTLVGFDYDGNERRGLTARCRREGGGEYVVAAFEVVFPPNAGGERYLAAYRKWMGLEPYPLKAATAPPRTRRHKATPTDLAQAGLVELVALSAKERAARCRLVGSDRVVTLRASGFWNVVPGEIVAVAPRKQWSYAGHPYLSGAIESIRLDVEALGLVPLGLEDCGAWDPSEEYWGEQDEPIEEWARPIIAKGPRQAFEMEQVLPGADPDIDPIIESNELKESGDIAGSRRILMELCQSDLRCLDAHAHLGNMVFDHEPECAVRHYEVGLRIGELSLGEAFNGLLPWGLIDNRPFLRCMSGFGLSMWRLGRFEEAGHIFERMLWLNPGDNQGVRFLIDDVRARRAWKEDGGRR